jgi:hypothetical protein
MQRSPVYYSYQNSQQVKGSNSDSDISDEDCADVDEMMVVSAKANKHLILQNSNQTPFTP